MAYEGNDEARSQTVPSSKGGDRIHPPLHMFFGFPISLPSYTLEQKSLRFSSTTSLHCIHKKGIKQWRHIVVETRRGLAPSQKVGNLAVSSFFLIHPSHHKSSHVNFSSKMVMSASLPFQGSPLSHRTPSSLAGLTVAMRMTSARGRPVALQEMMETVFHGVDACRNGPVREKRPSAADIDCLPAEFTDAVAFHGSPAWNRSQ